MSEINQKCKYFNAGHCKYRNIISNNNKSDNLAVLERIVEDLLDFKKKI